MSEHSDKLNTFATQLAANLHVRTEDRWLVTRPADDDYSAGAEISDGTRTLHLYFPSYAEKVEIAGIYPDVRQHGGLIYLHPEVAGFKGTARPRINVGINRKPYDAAGDIVRRLLPAYDAIREHVVAELAERNSDAAALAHALVRMAKSLQVEVPVKRQDHDDAPSEVRLPFKSGAPYGSFKSNHDGSSWKISLDTIPPALAEEIARTIARHRHADS